MPARPLVGRFAPSPTGALHLGSLCTALASFLDARARKGQWLVRIEDLDTPRIVPGKADEILRTLELHGLEWDGPILYQSKRTDAYRAAFDVLRESGRVFGCVCSRRALRALGERAYPGTCRTQTHDLTHAAARFRVAAVERVSWQDRFLGPQSFLLGELGDFVVRRRDGLFAYHLAVVVDDAAQGVTSIVRGSDLLSSTPWQMVLQHALETRAPEYAHGPLLTEPNGTKLSKTRRSTALDPRSVSRQLMLALSLLAQDPPAALANAPAAEILTWSIENWRIEPLAGRPQVALQENLVPGPALY